MASPRPPRSPRVGFGTSNARRQFQRPATANSVMSTNSIQSRDPTGVLRRAAKAQLGASYGGGGGGFAVTSGSYGGYGAGAGAGAGGGGGNVNIAVAQDLLNRAVKISEEELVEDTVDMRARNTDMHRVVVKKVHVPVKRRVKVPVTTLGKTKAMETRRVKTKKLVPVQGWKEVEEEYTVVEQRARTRDKVVWVKKIVQEEYMEPYTVKKKRMKKVPITQFKEVESYQDVQVEVEKPVEVQGYRVDEVEDVKEVEVEEEEVYQLVPQVRARRFLGTRETGVFQQANLSRTVGTKTYRAEEVQGIETDAHLSNVRLIDPIPLTATMKMHVEHVRQWLGITVRYTKGGLHVIRVQAGGPASRGGMCVGDWIVKVGGTRVTTLAALRSCLYSSSGSVSIGVDRGGRVIVLRITKNSSSSYSGGYAYSGTKGAAAASSARRSGGYNWSSSTTEGVVYSNHPGLSTTTQLAQYNTGVFIPRGHGTHAPHAPHSHGADNGALVGEFEGEVTSRSFTMNGMKQGGWEEVREATTTF